MKNLLLCIAMISSAGYAQTVTSIAAGNYYNPATWDCTCVPNDSDTIYVNHAVTLDFGITYSGELMQIGGGGSLLDAGSGNGIFIDGGNVMNIGTINVAGVLLDAGYLNNIGQFLVDSLWTRDSVDNMGIMDIYVNGWHENGGTFTNNGTIHVMNDYLNEAVFNNNSEMYVHHDFANCNLGASAATYEIGGLLCVYNDFTNCLGDTIRGNGTIRIKGSSSNAGEMEGNFIVNTPTGALTSNSGTIAPGITFGTGTCEVNISELNAVWRIFPNPATDVVMSSVENIIFAISDMSGRIVLSGVSDSGLIDVGSLPKGMFVIRLSANDKGEILTTILKKN